MSDLHKGQASTIPATVAPRSNDTTIATTAATAVSVDPKKNTQVVLTQAAPKHQLETVPMSLTQVFF